ncbi:dolichol kinase [Coccinella septempunctata]|uniref:dolichol kinase n=1 Tax=Coccinella septempunctata TaxID=41139 RepID=UPI001D08350D|nr:dolichol kinase [Coccinella septempunctata]
MRLFTDITNMNKLMNALDENFHIFSLGKKLNIEVRPNVSNGAWLLFLLPSAIIISALKHYVVLTETYKSVVLFSIGIIFTNIFILRSLKKEKYVKVYQLWIFIPISALYVSLNKELLFGIYSGLFCTILYSRVYLMVVKMFPRSFTLGEAGITAQALMILLYTTLPHFYYSIVDPITSTGGSSTVIIQMELFGIIILAGFLFYFNIEGVVVYFWTFLILLATFLLPLHVFLQRSPILWVLNLLVEDLATIKMILYWVICVCIAALAVIRQRNTGDKASSSQRKIFHILAVAVYIPGLMYECNLLYLGSGMLLGIFFILEILRNLKVPPLGTLLQESFMSLSDEKDAGIIAVTPIYLLTGFTTPIWLHPAPCDITDSAYFNFLPLLSGILSVGIGDTVASVFGSKYGKHFYHESKKTIEGTLASIVSQLLAVFVLYQIGFIVNMDMFNIIRISLAITVTSFVEAKTDQIDNAILPLIMYIMLI